MQKVSRMFIDCFELPVLPRMNLLAVCTDPSRFSIIIGNYSWEFVKKDTRLFFAGGRRHKGGGSVPGVSTPTPGGEGISSASSQPVPRALTFFQELVMRKLSGAFSIISRNMV